MNGEIIVEVLEEKPVDASGTFMDDDGKEVQWSTRKQAARLECDGFIYPYDVRLARDTEPFKKGRYRMVPNKMLTVNKGAANWSKFPVLEPLGAAK